MLTASTIIEKYLSFFQGRGHTKIPNSPLVLQNDPTTLFTSSGMQPLVPYLLGETHPQGKRLVNVQNCFRAQDIDEIGDNRHTTFFRMLGNWSLGDYFKKDQLIWIFTFLTKELELNPEKLYVTVYAGEGDQKVKKGELLQPLALDRESITIWTDLFKSVNIDAKFLDLKDLSLNVNQDEINEARIFSYGSNKNWWSRSGTPKQMPIGEPGGPDSEIFFDFGSELKIHENSPYKNDLCHPNCDCGRFMEIGNSVFMQYKKTHEDTFEELPNKNVDFGGGAERLLAALNNDPDIFKTTLFTPIIKVIKENLLKKFNYGEESRVTRAFRIIADHMIASVLLLADGVEPSNKSQGYIVRRLIRRAATQRYLWGDVNVSMATLVDIILEQYKSTNPKLTELSSTIQNSIQQEEKKFSIVLANGRKAWDNWVGQNAGEFGNQLFGVSPIGSGTELKKFPADLMFNLYQSFGLPLEVMEEITQGNIDKDGFKELLNKHHEVSKKGADKMFKGGLADTEEKTIMGHTATHLLHQALRDILGSHVHQTGSNITTERLRFDFNYEQKLTDEQVKKIESIVNEKIQENLPVHFEMIPTEKAKKMGAIGLFSETYGATSKIYFIGKYSIEFCGGPHVDFTGKLKRFTIIKQENLGNGQKRLYATVGV